MKTLLIPPLLAMGMQAQAFTIVRIGPKVVAGTVSASLDPGGRYLAHVANFSLQKDRDWVDSNQKTNFMSLKLTAPENKFIQLKGMKDLESPFTVVILDTNKDPMTVTWFMDTKGELMHKSSEAERDKELQHRINSLIKGEHKAAPGGPDI